MSFYEVPRIDLAQPMFWLVFLAAVALLAPLTFGPLRKLTFAGINVTLLNLLLPWPLFYAALGAIVVTWLLLQTAGAKGRLARFAASMALGGAVLGLFLVHKLPGVSGDLGLGSFNPLLAAVGFSYLALRIVDVLRAVLEGRHEPPDLASTVNYLVPFHMLAAGPIQAYDEFVAQPAVPPKPKVRDVLEGVERIAKGLFKKLVLAYLLDELFLTGFRAGGWYLIFEAQVFSVWLFLDFSGYSDIAVGMGRLMGVATPENFDHPYFARNMINYWERWHITLGMFIRRNLFIPVQLALMRRTGARHPLWCAGVAFVVAFGLCGMWHGISLQFAAWGLLHAGGMVVNNLWRYALTRRYGAKGFRRYLADRRFRVAAILLTFEFVAFSLVVAFYPLEKLF